MMVWRVISASGIATLKSALDLENRYGEVRALVFASMSRYIHDSGWEEEDFIHGLILRLLKIETSAARFDPAKGAFSTWVVRIARQYASNLKRTEAHRIKTDQMAEGWDALAAPGYEYSESALNEILDTLPEDSRRIVNYYRNGYDRRDIARIENRSDDWVTIKKRKAQREILQAIGATP